MMKRLFAILSLLLPLVLCAETVRDIIVSADKPYTDNITLAREAGDMDVMVKFAFDEQNNQLTVSLISYRGLFVFRDDARYKQVVKCSKLKVDALPYVAASEPLKYKMPYKFRKQLGKHRKGFVFRRWITYTSVVPEPMEYQMVNDVIEQKFAIVGEKSTSVTVTIGDVMIMEPKMNCLKKPYYEFLHFASVDTKYRITVLRNPCFALEEQISIANQQVAAVKQAFSGLKTTFPDGVTTSQETFDLFTTTKATMQEQFPPRDTLSPCPDLKKANVEYDMYVDSINAFSCRLENQVANNTGLEANPAFLLSVSYQIDMNVSRWLLSNDPMERKDIITECKELVNYALEYVGMHGVHTTEMKNAYDVFTKAFKYFKTTCNVR